MNAEQAWQATIGQLQMDMSKAAFETWVKGARLVGYADSTFTVGVNNAYARDWLDTRLSDTVRRVLSGIMNRQHDVRFTVLQNDIPLPEPANADLPEAPAQPAADCGIHFENPTVNHRYTF